MRATQGMMAVCSALCAFSRSRITSHAMIAMASGSLSSWMPTKPLSARASGRMRLARSGFWRNAFTAEPFMSSSCLGLRSARLLTVFRSSDTDTSLICKNAVLGRRAYSSAYPSAPMLGTSWRSARPRWNATRARRASSRAFRGSRTSSPRKSCRGVEQGMPSRMMAAMAHAMSNVARSVAPAGVKRSSGGRTTACRPSAAREASICSQRRVASRARTPTHARGVRQRHHAVAKARRSAGVPGASMNRAVSRSSSEVACSSRAWGRCPLVERTSVAVQPARPWASVIISGCAMASNRRVRDASLRAMVTIAFA